MPKKPIRRLFLDDDPDRASAFLEQHPDAVWVKTVAECVEKLAETWDEIHLDHDLGGEMFVDVNREDCGMEVVRWLAKEPRKYLRRSRFTVHSHNMVAAFEMSYRLRMLGFRVETRPFDIEPPDPEPSIVATLRGRIVELRLGERARNLIRRARGLSTLAEADPAEADPPDYVP